MSEQVFDIAVYADRLVTMSEAREVLSSAVIGILDDRIAFIGSNQKIRAQQTIQKKDSIVIPGMINAHTHIPMTNMRGMADDLRLMDWLQNYIFPTEKKFVNEEFVYWGSKLGAMEMIASGTTMFCDMFYFTPSIAKAAHDVGIRGLLAHDCGLPYFQHLSLDERIEQGIELSIQYFEQLRDYKTIKMALGPHAVYSISSEKHLREISNLSMRLNIPISIHVAESMTDTELIEKGIGKKIRSTVQYLHDIGFFQSNVLSVHTIWVDDEDMDLLAKNNVHVAHCPQSNLKIASGIAPVEKMIEKNIVVALGTDGAASNNDLILWEEMQLAAMLHKGKTLDPTVIPAKKAFEMATIDGARALWMDHEIGSIEVGKKADLVLIDRETTHQHPQIENIYSQLVYSTKSTDVATVIVDGKVVYKDRQFTMVDKNEVFAQSKKIRFEIDQFLKTKNL